MEECDASTIPECTEAFTAESTVLKVKLGGLRVVGLGFRVEGLGLRV